ncbi:hypothetical protein Syun_025377 [Stephania yunnanensis]|uniref:non-specific serine/threonine protein kinase n=1 Tax=Stephania yunnanensis TaxID=152371 RepID=A0AAP0EUH2_9MAGN
MGLPGSPELFIIKKASRKIWRTGPWNGQAWNGVPGMRPNPIVNHSLVNDPNEIYTTYTVSNTSVFSRVKLDYLGFVRRKTWVDSTGWNTIRSYPDDTCDNYGKCGAFGRCNSNYSPICSCLPGFKFKSSSDTYALEWSQSCGRKRQLLCGKGDGFLKLEKMKLPDTSNARVDMSLGIKDCEIGCRNNCSCTGYASADVDGSGCLVWFGTLSDAREFPEWGQDMFIRVDAIELKDSMKDSKGSFTKKKVNAKRSGLMHREKIPKQLHNLAFSETNEETNAKFELPVFYFDSMIVATENFSPANMLGTGGFGSVYKGKSLDGREIAVKRLSRHSGQGVNEFKNEVVLIAKLQHRNLVQILGMGAMERGKAYGVNYLTLQWGVHFLNKKLRRNETTIPIPKQPAFVLTSKVDHHQSSSSTTGTGSCSVNEMSTTIVEGR